MAPFRGVEQLYQRKEFLMAVDFAGVTRERLSIEHSSRKPGDRQALYVPARFQNGTRLNIPASLENAIDVVADRGIGQRYLHSAEGHSFPCLRLTLDEELEERRRCGMIGGTGRSQGA